MFTWIAEHIEAWGAPGIAFLMFAENVFPPIPSELIMPLAGFNAAAGAMSLFGVLVAGIAGSLAGALLWYLVGLCIGVERLKAAARRNGRLLTVTPDEIDRADRWFDRHGGTAVLVGRVIPTIRTFISVPAGVSGMALPRFLMLSALGTAVWTTALTLLGYWLGAEHERVIHWLNPISLAVLIGLALIYVWRVATFGRRVREG